MSRLSHLFVELLSLFTEARIDIKNQGEKCDLEISPFDAVSNISSPEWFSENGKGYTVTSRNTCLDLVLTCVNDGVLHVWLRGKDVRDNNTGERIPIWIDYTGLTVNDSTLQLFSQIKIA